LDDIGSVVEIDNGLSGFAFSKAVTASTFRVTTFFA